MKRMNRGIWIDFEGPNRSTLEHFANLLQNTLSQNKCNSLILQQSTSPMELLLKVYENGRIQFHPYPLTILELADRLEQQLRRKEGIRDILSSGKNMISIQFVPASFINQQDLPIDWLKHISNVCIQPDRMIYIDIPTPESQTEVFGKASKGYYPFLEKFVDDISKLVKIEKEEDWIITQTQIMELMLDS